MLTFIQTPEMADALRQDGKFWVVFAVIMVVLISIFIYLFSLDKKLTKIEKGQQS